MSQTVHVFRVQTVAHCPVTGVPGDTDQEAVDKLRDRIAETGKEDGGLVFHVDDPGHLVFAVENENGVMQLVTPTEAEAEAERPPSGEIDIERLEAMWGDDDDVSS